MGNDCTYAEEDLRGERIGKPELERIGVDGFPKVEGKAVGVLVPSQCRHLDIWSQEGLDNELKLARTPMNHSL
jgi:hypothetical protein